MKHIPRQRNSFTLIELLIVIAIIGILSMLIIPQLSNVEDEANDTINNYNASAINNFMETFKTANGAYPANLSTGLTTADGTDLISTLPPVLVKMINDSARIEPINTAALARAGMISLAYSTTDNSTYFTVDTPATINAIRITDDWRTQTDSGEVIRVAGTPFKELLGYTDGLAEDNPAKLKLYMFVMGPYTNTQAVYRANGTMLSNSRVSRTIKLAPENASGTIYNYYNYPIVIFGVENGKVSYYGSLLSTRDGTTLINK